MRIKIIGSRPKKPSLISKLICWYENKTNRWDFYKYIIQGKYAKEDISHIIILIDTTVNEAVRKGFLSCKLEDWLKENYIIWEQDLVQFFNFSEERCLKFKADCEAMIKADIDYGTPTLFGIILNDKTGLTWFADGAKTTICSEAPLHLLKEEVALTKPIDYYTPKDLVKLLKMKFVWDMRDKKKILNFNKKLFIE